MICLNHSVLDFMEPRIEGRRVLELGGGFSSLWFAERCDELVTIDTDRGWVDLIASDLEPFDRAFVFHADPITAVQVKGTFDLVLVDCVKNQRHNAALFGWEVLKRGGYMVFDDAQRSEHRATCNHFGESTYTLTWDASRDIPGAKDRVALAWRKP